MGSHSAGSTPARASAQVGDRRFACRYRVIDSTICRPSAATRSPVNHSPAARRTCSPASARTAARSFTAGSFTAGSGRPGSGRHRRRRHGPIMPNNPPTPREGAVRAPGRQGLPPPRPGHPRVPEPRPPGPDRTGPVKAPSPRCGVPPVPAANRSPGRRGGCYPPNSGNDWTGPRRPARTSTPPGAPAPGNAATPDTDCGGLVGQVEQRVQVTQRVTVGDHRCQHRRERGGGAAGRAP